MTSLMEHEVKEDLESTVEDVAIPHYTTTLSLHELLKARLVSIGFRHGYTAIPEFTSPQFDRVTQRVDVGWFKNNSLIAAFEIENGGESNGKTVEKLEMLDSIVTTYIVSVGPFEVDNYRVIQLSEGMTLEKEVENPTSYDQWKSINLTDEDWGQ